MISAAVVRGGAAKENDGRRRRRRMVVRAVVFLGVTMVSYHLLWTYWLAGVFVPDYEIDPTTGRKKFRRRPDRLYKTDKFTQEKVPTNPLDGIMEGYLTLVGITLPKEGLIQAGRLARGADYERVKGTFCHISWQLQQQNPAQVPMFRDLQQQSPLCASTMVRDLDLFDIAQKARAYDRQRHNFTATEPRAGHQAVPPTAVVFHETRCGSTLVSNLLARSLPTRVRSYSESPPPLQALLACDSLEQAGKYCDNEAQLQLIRDVFYLQGRVTRPEPTQYVFYKIQSIGVRFIHLFTQAMPKVPWAFIYRDSVEIMMSHFKHQYLRSSQQQEPKKDEDTGRPVCLRSYGNHKQHPLLQEVVKKAGRNMTLLSKEEYCAAHLASLAQAAVTEYQKNPPENNFVRKMWFFDHKNLPHTLWEDFLPRLHMGYINADAIARMHEMATIYSKAREGSKDGATSTKWHDDSAAKQAKAPQKIKDAAHLFLDTVYQTMTEIENTQK